MDNEKLKELLLDDFEAGFPILFDKFDNQILYLCFNYVKDWGLAEDITQDVFIQCYEKFDQFRWNSSIRTWLFRIAINRCKDELKSYRFKNVVASSITFFNFIKGREKSPEHVVADKNERENIVEKVFELPVKYREVIILYYYEELTIKEIADALSLKISNVKTRLRRARQQLSDELREGDSFG